MPVGRVAVVPGGPPFSRIVRELGPTMGLVGGGVLGVGTALIAFVVFGPARRRLKHVQDATERLGAGDLTARAPAGGGDEVAAVARSFNRMADELTAARAALEASDKARRQLLADVSHELMTPLTAMRGYIETLTMPELQLDDATRPALPRRSSPTKRIGSSASSATCSISRGSKAAAARCGSEPVDVAVRCSIAWRRGTSASCANARVTLVQRRVEPARRTVVGDPDRLEQALQNLAANALRHTPDGGAITLDGAAVEPTSAAIRICACATPAPGIAAEHLPLIFDRFYKVDAARKAAGGSGLGLSIVKAIVERHGGTIAAYNAIDPRGAVFEIVLPAPSE